MASLETDERALASHFPSGTRFIPLKGDASTRRFCRVALPDSRTRVLMIYPQPFVWEGSPLESSHRHLEAMGVPVPEIERVFPEQGAVLLEDLGDTTLQMALGGDPTL